MDVYTTSFNVYPFAVGPTYGASQSPSAAANLSSYPASNLASPQGNGAAGSGGPYGSRMLNGVPMPPYGQPETSAQQQQHPGPYSATPVTPAAGNTSGAVHRHHSTLSGVEVVWDHLHRLTLQAMAQFPGTHISFTRTASSASSSLSEDSLALLGLGPSSSNPNLTNPSSSTPMLPSLSNVSPISPLPPGARSTGNINATATGGVISANANAALHGAHTRGTAFNITITGSSQTAVLGARGLILRESPVQNRSVIKVARSEILEPAARPPPSAVPGGSAHSNGSSPVNGTSTGNMGNGKISSVPMPGSAPSPSAAPASSGGALKQPVIQKLDEIAAQTRANISVLKTSSSSSNAGGASSAMMTPSASGAAPTSSGHPSYSPYSAYPSPTPSTWSSAAPTSYTSWPSSFASSSPSATSGGAANGGTGVSPGGGGGGGSFGGANAAAQAAGLEGEKTCELIITGPGDTVDVARLRLLVMLDELSGLHAEQVDIDFKLHAIVAGRRRRAVQEIQESTATNIYFPPLPLHAGAPSVQQPGSLGSNPGSPGAFGVDGGANGLPPPTTPMSRQNSAPPLGPGGGIAMLGYNPNTIWITGEFFNVGRARDALYQLAGHKVRTKTIISRDMVILSRKLDWMLTHRLDDIKSIDRDNGTYITFPPIGSGTSLCTIYGDARMTIERTVRAVMLLASQFYIASIYLLPLQYNMLVPSANGLNPAAMGGVLRAVCSRSGAEMVCKAGMFEVSGLESEVRAAVAMILELDIIKNFQTEIRFQLELATEHRDFISGKKNGKLNKIMTNTSVKIKFESLNDHNFLIDVTGSSALNVLRGLTLLQDELPAELAFHVPEAYHKRIIGVAGRSIQRIMKKYGVYVKFNSAEEMRQLALDDEENVLARTPAKNALNLENLRSSIMELVPAKDKDFIVDTVPVPRRYHRALFGDKAVFLRDIESKTNCKITFPGDGLDIVSIFGPESQVHHAGAMLLDHVPFEAELTLPSHPELPRICSSQEFLQFTEHVQRDIQVSIIPSPDNALGYPFVFKFICQRSNCDYLSPARELFDTFLSNHGALHSFPSSRKLSTASMPPTGPGIVGQGHISGAGTPSGMATPNSLAPGSGQVFGNGHIHRRVDSFTDAFPHFNSRLLPTPLESDGLNRRIRMASSTPDVKSLFNSPANRYRAPEQRVVPEQDEFDDSSYYSRSSISSVGPPINVGGLHEFDGPLNEYRNGNNDYSLNDHWMAATPTNSHVAGFHGYAPPRALAHADDAYKRGSDSAIEAKLREKLAASQRQHNASARAQSLDLTSLGMTSRGISSTPGLGESTIDEAGGEVDGEEESSEPLSAMMPTFPSLSDVPLAPNHLMGSIKPRSRVPAGAVDPRTGRNPVLETEMVTTNDMHSMFASLNLDSPVP